MSECKGCKQEIKWIKSKAGKSIPVDLDLYHIQDNLVDSNLMVVSPSGEVGKLINLEQGYISHFSTCVKANDFRKTNK